MNKSIAIQFNRVSKSYPIYSHLGAGLKGFIFNLPKALKGLARERFTALENISFDINRGETVAFMGRNGAGKSTTLGLIAQVLKSTSGTVAVHGRVSPLLELGGGFHSDLTGRENILLNGVLLGLSRKTIKEKEDSIIGFSELGNFIDQPIRMYSSGMLSRLGFSVVAHLDPEILLVDEVLAVGDIAFQEKCKNKITEFKKSGVTIVLVSHSIDDVRKLCDRVIWIENHKIQMDGPTTEVLPVYEKYFV